MLLIKVQIIALFRGFVLCASERQDEKIQYHQDSLWNSVPPCCSGDAIFVRKRSLNSRVQIFFYH